MMILIITWFLVLSVCIIFITPQKLSGHHGLVTDIKFDKWHIVTGSKDGYSLVWSAQGDHARCLTALRHPKYVLLLTFLLFIHHHYGVCLCMCVYTKPLTSMERLVVNTSQYCTYQDINPSASTVSMYLCHPVWHLKVTYVATSLHQCKFI